MQQGANNTILVIGLGMIGGSVARGLREQDPGLRILAADRDAAAIEAAQKDGVINAGSTEAASVASEADIVVLAVPVLAFAAVLQQIAPVLKSTAIVTDVASVKLTIVKLAKETLSGSFPRFVPGHPIAGSEKSGYGAASAALFKGRKVILTPVAETDCKAVNQVAGLWRRLGAEVLGMSTERHDTVLAATSHLPHLLSFALVDVLLKQQQSEDIFRYAAGGFADFSRLASSDPTMWADIFVANAVPTVAVLEQFIQQLQSLKPLLIQGDHAALKLQFVHAKQARDKFIRKYFQAMKEAPQKTPEIQYQVQPGGKVVGDIRVPGDKSISHRAVIFGSIAEGVTSISGFLQGEDALNTLAAFRAMGVTIVGPEDGRVTIYGAGMHGLQAPAGALYMGNSGTAMRLLCGLLSAQSFATELTGDESLNRRPMKRVTEPLTSMGARVTTAPGGTPPLAIQGAALQGIVYDMPVASAQVKSCLLLAGLYAQGKVTIREPGVCRDHTERMLQGFAYPVTRQGNTVSLQGGGVLKAAAIDIPADISSAAFFLVAATITPGADLLLRHVGVNPTRTGIIKLLTMMGADIQLSNAREVGGEPVADLRVRHANLTGIDIPAEQIPLAIDEFPVLFVAAACASGVTRLRGAEELRVKESDRIQVMADGLQTLGIKTRVYPDGLDVEGGKLTSGTVHSHGDHRIAMAFTVAALRASGAVRILDCANVATSFPGFVDLARQVGIQVTQSPMDPS